LKEGGVGREKVRLLRGENFRHRRWESESWGEERIKRFELGGGGGGGRSMRGKEGLFISP